MERKKEKAKTDDDDDVAASLVTDASGKKHSSSNESSQRTDNARYSHGETSKRGRDQHNDHSSDKRRRSSGSSEQDDDGTAGLEVLAAAASSVRKTGGKKAPQSRSGGTVPVPIEQYDIITGKTIAEYDSQRAAERATNVDNGSISECVRGIAVSAGGFGWREAGTEGRTVSGAAAASGGNSSTSKKPSSSSSSSDRRLGKTAVTVQQYDLTTGLTIGQFESQRAAARALGIDRNDICDCIQGKLPHAGFFGWRKISTDSSGNPPSTHSYIYPNHPLFSTLLYLSQTILFSTHSYTYPIISSPYFRCCRR